MAPRLFEIMEKSENKKKLIAPIAGGIVIALGLIVGFFVIKNVKDKDPLEKYVSIETKENTSGETESESSNSDEGGIKINIDWDGLNDLNPDIYAYIYVPGTDVSYPILQKENDNDFYLTRDVKGKEDDNGCLYTQVMYDDKSFDDEFTVIYGRNAKDGSMFASLHNFEDYGCFDENRFFYIYTPEKTYTYQIYAAYVSDDTHLFYKVQKDNVMSLQWFVESLQNLDPSKGIVSNEMYVTFIEKFVVLQTGTGDDATRFNVVGVLVE